MNPLPSALTCRDLIAALDLPDAARVNQRIPKKLLVENGPPAAADKKLLRDGIDEITWVAALKPANIGVPEWVDERRAYVELAVLCVGLRQYARTTRIAQLIHRTVPYPVVLLLDEEGADGMFSLAHIRLAQVETGKTVLDDAPVGVRFSDPGDAEHVGAFLQALSLSRQPRTDLYSLYQGWVDTITALQAAAITGRFAVSASSVQAVARRAALHRCREIDREMAGLRLAAAKEKQMARQVAINLDIQELEKQRAQAVAGLHAGNP